MNLNFLLEPLAALLASAGESKLEPILIQLKKDQPQDYEAAAAGARALITHLKPLVSKTSTRLDDIFISGLEDAFDVADATDVSNGLANHGGDPDAS